MKKSVAVVAKELKDIMDCNDLETFVQEIISSKKPETDQPLISIESHRAVLEVWKNKDRYIVINSSTKSHTSSQNKLDRDGVIKVVTEFLNSSL